jgi:hypothetical protein
MNSSRLRDALAKCGRMRQERGGFHGFVQEPWMELLEAVGEALAGAIDERDSVEALTEALDRCAEIMCLTCMATDHTSAQHEAAAARTEPRQ